MSHSYESPKRAGLILSEHAWSIAAAKDTSTNLHGPISSSCSRPLSLKPEVCCIRKLAPRNSVHRKKISSQDAVPAEVITARIICVA